MTEDKIKKASKDCLCLYDLDDITIDDLIKHKTTRKELIEIQIKKYYRIDSENNKNTLKEERREEVMNWLKMEDNPWGLLDRIQRRWSEVLSK